MKKRRTAWIGCSTGVVLLCVAAFSPLIIPMGTSEPEFWGIPRTLWAGIVIYLLIVGLTLVGTRVHPDIRDPGGDAQ